MQDRDEFGERVDGHPQPEHLRSIAKPRAEFVKLDMREMEVTEPVVVQRRTVLAGACQPGGDRRVGMTKHPFRCRDVQPFGQRRQHFADTPARRLEPIERRVAPGAERRPARLTAQGLDALTLAMRADADEGVDVGVGDTVIDTGGVGTGEAIGGDAFRSTASALEFAPGVNRWRWCNCGGRPGALAPTGRTISRRAGFEQALHRRSNRGSGRLVPTMPKPHDPERTDQQRDGQCVDVSSHRGSFALVHGGRWRNYPRWIGEAPSC